jgi:Zn-dependent protease with chaperone function
MDFFARQDNARKRTGRLLVLYGIAVVCIIAAVHGVVAGVLSPKRLWDPALVAVDVAVTLLVILCGVGVTWAGFTGGGPAVAESCGGRLVDPSSRDPLERRLLNVVEEMSIASGVPVPPVFVLEEEDGINAFAAGRTTSDAAVAVTHGALEHLTRDELQGVVGHEFSHILNGDMRLNMKLAAWLGGILGLALIGEILLRALGNSRPRHSRSRDRDGDKLLAALFIIGLALFIIGYLGVFFARLIQAAVSRQREHLADAAAVQFTRNPLGLAGALKKIAGYSGGSALRSPRASMLRHMFFSNAGRPSWLDFMMATHPPIEKRIRWLDPAFNPEMARLAAMARPASRDEGEAVSELAQRGAGAAPLARRNIAGLCAQVGNPSAADLSLASGLVRDLPRGVTDAARDPLGACALVYALLLADDPALREWQMKRLRETAAGPAFEDLQKLEPLPVLGDRARKLPLLDLALAGLRRMNRPQFERFNTTLEELIASDGFLDLFEFTLRRVMRRHLAIYFGLSLPFASQPVSIAAAKHECLVLLSCLSRQGHKDDPVRALAAFRAGWRELLLPKGPDGPLEQSACRLDALELALDRLSLLSFPFKKRVLTACVAAISADGEVRVEEAELLRAVSDTLDCPVPLA